VQILDKLLSNLRMRLADRLPAGVYRILRPFLTVQFITFMGIGIINTISAAAVATVLDIIKCLVLDSSHPARIFIENFRTNFITGYVFSIILSFFLNSKYTFCQKPTWQRFIKFPISYIPNFLFQYIMVFLFTSLNWNSTAAYITAAIFGTPITFISMKLMVFRKNSTTR
jgi:hypothetical protein